MNKPIRLRFAPSPTGMMHLGNIRTALMNDLFAKKKNGTFILRIEDTDAARNFDPGAQKIIADLHWLGLFYDEGPEKGGAYAPYFQSERTAIYQQELDKLIECQAVYRCFCTPEELEKQRGRQIALKKPPRYDRTCLSLDKATIDQKINIHIPFIWRYKLDHAKNVTITDLAHGPITFELKNFSDFPLTRGDGSFTFIFANFVDDMLMRITHIIRGEDHLTNTACQAVLFEAFKTDIPTFWHLPILCNIDGKKLSKRDFGFSLRDLKQAGFLPEALLNYLGVIGGGSFAQEIMSFEQLAQAIDFDHIHATGQVKFDSEKLKWVNNKWINRLEPNELYERCLPVLCAAYPNIEKIEKNKLITILQILKTDLFTLNDAVNTLRFYFEAPTLKPEQFDGFEQKELLSAVVSHLIAYATDNNSFSSVAKQLAQEKNISLKNLFGFIRLGLMGTKQGPAIHEIIDILGIKESKERLKKLIAF